MKSPFPPDSFSVVAPPHRTALLYQDIGTIEPGLALTLQLGSELGLDVGCPEHHAWLRMLENPGYADDLLRQTLASSYLVLSLRGDTRPSRAVRQWLCAWLEAAHAGCSALMVLFAPEHSESRAAAAIRQEIEQMAMRAGVDAFFYEADATAPTADEVLVEAGHDTEDMADCFLGAMHSFTEVNERLLGIA